MTARDGRPTVHLQQTLPGFENIGTMKNQPDHPPAGLTYAESGVDIERADRAKEGIKRLARSTFNSGVAGDIGSFGGLYRVPFSQYERPLLVSSADGVGTKLKIAFLTGVHETVGIDLVAHCTNDILVQGANPLFLMDYLASGRLDPGVVEKVVAGVAQGCRQSGCALLGGETAEMPDFYQPGEYDLAGFIVGLAEERHLLGEHRVQAGDVLIGLRSSGLHTNGFSLVRKLLLEMEKMPLDGYIPELGRTLAEELLEPHRNYLTLLRQSVETDDLHALAHITGGGIPGNLNRVLGPKLDAHIERGSWEIPPIFRMIRERGKIDDREMFRTFNMGLGMILVVAQGRASRFEEFLQRKGEPYFVVGEVVTGQGRVTIQ